jgi:hypothetical protein
MFVAFRMLSLLVKTNGDVWLFFHISSLFLFHFFLIFYLKLIWHLYIFPDFSSFMFVLPFSLYFSFLSSSVFIRHFLLSDSFFRPCFLTSLPSNFHRRSIVPSTTLSIHFRFIYHKNNKNEAGSKLYVTRELHEEQLTVVRQNHILEFWFHESTLHVFFCSKRVIWTLLISLILSVVTRSSDIFI